jgi:hypothetical protein
MGFSLKKLVKGVVAEVNPFDHGQNFKSVTQAPASNQPAPASTARPQASRPSLEQRVGGAINKVAGSHLKGIEQLTGRNDVTVGKVAMHTPILGDAIKFSSKPNQSTGDFVKAISTTGAKNAPYVVPEAKVVKPGTSLVSKGVAKFANNAVPAALTSPVADVATGERDPSKMIEHAAAAAGFNGVASAALPVAKATTRLVRSEAKAGFPQLQNEAGHIILPGESPGTAARRIHESAKVEAPTFINDVADTAHAVGGQFHDDFAKNAVKGLKKDGTTDLTRMTEKLAQKGRITDALRSTVIVNHPDDAQAAIAHLESKGYKVWNDPETGLPDVTNRHLDRKPGDYTDVAVKLVKGDEDPIVKELQFIQPNMFAAKKAEGHGLYKIERTAAMRAAAAKTPEDRAVYEAAYNHARQRAAELYDKAYSADNGASAARPSTASDLMSSSPSLSPNASNDLRRSSSETPNTSLEPTSANLNSSLDTGITPPSTPNITQKTTPVNEPGDFAREPQTLNPNRLDLDNSQRADVLEMTSKDVLDKLSNKEIIEIAKTAGIDYKSHGKQGTALKIAEQFNTRRAVVEASNKYAELKNSGASPEAVAAAFEDTFIKANTSTAQGTDLARQLQARRILADELDTPMQKVIKLLGEAGVDPAVAAKKAVGVDWEDAESVAKFYRELVPAKFGDWLDLVRYNSMLSSPLTHAVNIFSNGMNAGIIAPTEKALNGAIDLFTSKLTGAERKAFAGEGAAYLKGYVMAGKDATKALMDTLSGKRAVDNLDVRDIPLAHDGAAGEAYKVLSVPTKLLGGMDIFFRTL